MLEANFPPGKREVSVFGLTQWDKGQKLCVSFENMPDSFQIHFSVRGSDEATVVEVRKQGTQAIADIPDELLTNEGDISAWIYLTGDDTGETVGRAILYVRPRPRPKGYIEDLVPSQQKIVENMITELKNDLEYVKENGVNAEYVPEYVRKEALRVAKNVLSHQNENTLSFVIASDTHYDGEDYYSVKSTEHLGHALRIMSSVCKVDFSAFLGGYISDTGNKNISDAKNEILSVNKELYSGFGDKTQFRCCGPDEMLSASYYRNGDFIDRKELFPLIGKWCGDAVYNENDVLSGYCYKDFEEHKIRVICLNTSEFINETVKPETFKAKMSADQLIWLCDAMNLSSKKDSSSWGIIFLSHYPFNYYSAFYAVKEILKAYSTGSEVSLLDSEGKEVKYDFLGKCSAPVIAQFHGALHNFKVNYLEDVSLPMICIPNAGYYDNNIFADDKYTSDENLLYGEDITYYKVSGTKEDTAFCVVTMDMSDGKIYVDNYGAGYDREISFDAVGGLPSIPELDPDPDPGTGGDDDDEGGESGTYTNLVSLSTDSSGDIFNLCGYINDFSLDSSGEETDRDGFTMTGYIPCSCDDTIRISGGQWSNASGNLVVAYDDSYIPLWSAQLSGNMDGSSGLSYSGGVAVFIGENVTNGELSDMAFIRVSCEGDGENLIVTANEEIPSDEQGETTVLPPVVEYNNIIPYATDESGERFNMGLGYMDDFCLDENGDMLDAEGFTVTGFLYCELGSVIRFKGCNWTNDEGNYLVIYDSDYIPVIAVAVNSTSNNTENGITFNSDVLVFDSSSVTSCEMPTEFFVRISTKTSGENLIATYNQELS